MSFTKAHFNCRPKPLFDDWRTKKAVAEAVDAAEVLRGFYADEDGTDGEQVDRSADEQPTPSATFTEDDERDPFMAGGAITASLDAELGL